MEAKAPARARSGLRRKPCEQILPSAGVSPARRSPAGPQAGGTQALRETRDALHIIQKGEWPDKAALQLS